MPVWKKIFSKGIILRIGFGLFLVLFGYWMLFAARTPYPGNRAPDLTIYSLYRGIPYRLSAFRGRWIMLNFWASWCPPCRDEFPDMVRLWQAFRRDNPWTFLWVSVAEPEADARAFVETVAEQVGVNARELPVFIDTAGQSGPRFGVWKYPETFIINPQGVIKARIIGPRRWSDSTWRQRFQILDFTAVR